MPVSDKEPIRLFVPFYRTEECLSEIRDCLEEGWTGLGNKTLLIESAWKKYTGMRHAHFLNSATAGLHLAIAILKREFGWDEGDEVITTPLTFVSTNHAILYERLQPIFADVDESLCLSPDSIESRITDRTRAVVFVGVGGNTGRLADVQALCAKHNLALILDAAHMSGTRLNGKHVGTEADVAVFSYHSVKNLPTADAGMICFRDEHLDRAARRLSWLGIDRDTYTRTQEESRSYKWKYNVEDVGFKYHGNSIMAAMALVGLKYLDEDNAYRRDLCSDYDHQLEGNPLITVVRPAAGCESSRHLYQVLVDQRDEIILYLNEQSIYPGVHYADNTSYPMYGQAAGTCPNAARAAKRTISLPLHLKLTKDDVRRVAEELHKAVVHVSRTTAAV